VMKKKNNDTNSKRAKITNKIGITKFCRDTKLSLQLG
jgi:hypothetical protein